MNITEINPETSELETARFREKGESPRNENHLREISFSWQYKDYFSVESSGKTTTERSFTRKRNFIKVMPNKDCIKPERPIASIIKKIPVNDSLKRKPTPLSAKNSQTKNYKDSRSQPKLRKSGLSRTAKNRSIQMSPRAMSRPRLKQNSFYVKLRNLDNLIPTNQ